MLHGVQKKKQPKPSALLLDVASFNATHAEGDDKKTQITKIAVALGAEKPKEAHINYKTLKVNLPGDVLT